MGIRKTIKKADIVLIACLVAAGLVFSYMVSFGQDEGQMLSVRQDGQIIGTYPLSEDAIIPVESEHGSNTIQIKDGIVSMQAADCKGQDCVDMGEISQTGQTIVCLPHKLVIELVGDDAEVDAVAQ